MATFKDCYFFVVGSFEGLSQPLVKKLLTENGGTLVNSITHTNTTHILAGKIKGKKTKAEAEPWIEINIARASASNPILRVIQSLDWVQDSIKAGIKLDEDKYVAGGVKLDEQVEKEVEKQQEEVPLLIEDENKKGKGKRVRSPSIDNVAPAVVKILKKGKAAVDHRMNNSSNFHVIEVDGVYYDAMLNQTNVKNNNNKFYIIQVLKEDKAERYYFINAWGRVGENGNINVFGPFESANPAINDFHKKFKNKTKLDWEDRNETPFKDKYTYLERSYEEEDEEEDSSVKAEGSGSNPSKKAKIADKVPVESKLKPEVQSLMKFIFDPSAIQQTLSSFEYDSNKLPLGKLSNSTIQKGYATLKSLSDLVKDPSLAKSEYNTNPKEASIELTNDYYTLIPHSFGRSKPPVLNSQEQLKKELEMLETLAEIKFTQEIIKAGENQGLNDEGEDLNPLDSQFKQLGLSSFELIDKSTKEFKTLETLILNTKGSTHTAWDLKLIDAFSVERSEETSRSNSNQNPEVNNQKLLFHGSRATNFSSILSKGLKISPLNAPTSGTMLGKGIHFSSLSSKSAQYCYHSISNNEGLILICEVDLGREYKLEAPQSEAETLSKEAECNSTYGIGKIQPTQWIDASELNPNLNGVIMPSTEVGPSELNSTSKFLYDEFVVYQEKRVRIRYLIRVGFE